MAFDVSAESPQPTSQNIRGAVQRSLPYIEKVAAAWMQDRKCNSCHNVTFLVWTHNEAAARGFEIDRMKLKQWTKWSLADSLSDRYWFKLRPQAFAFLKAGGFPEALLAKLKPLEGKTYLTQQEYLHALEKAVGHENLAANKERLLKLATLPNNGGGPDTLSQLLLGQAASIQDENAKRSYVAIRSLLLQWQEPDGSWEAQGQLPGLKWAAATEMNEATTMWSLLAVSAGNSNDKALVRSRDRALESLKKLTPESTLQTLALHLVIAHKFDEPARAEALLKELVRGQHEDGGWGWVKEAKGSDAFATGQALYALGLLGHDGKDPVVSRAWEFLLRTQEKDGSWNVPQEAINTRPRSLNVYDFWGTAWATIGTLQTLPAADHPP
ncbi:MAG TPA: prenyltransferase/squalene oxidase repeat-containing protein [Lacipirellulaceae bacterium]|nr:prenyltransferase/squalene oxidase repeat-containing protein [Lacipirellulaceae bacterium]